MVVLLQDITAAKLEKIDRSGQMNAVNLTQAVIEFTLDGTILTANQNFLQTVGYQLDEIKGGTTACLLMSSINRVKSTNISGSVCAPANSLSTNTNVSAKGERDLDPSQL